MNLKHFPLLFLLLGISFLSYELNSQTVGDSIHYYLRNSKNSKLFDFETRLRNAKKAKAIAEKRDIDSLKVKVNLVLAEIYSEKALKDEVFRVCNENFKLTTKIQDTSALARTNYILADFYRRNNYTDSAYHYYHESEVLFRSLKDYYNTAKSIHYSAVIQKNEKDYTGSELASIEAYKLLDNLEQTDLVIRQKAYVCNNLGIIFDELGEYDEAIKYHKKALDLKERLKGNKKQTIYTSKSNLAQVYEASGNYEKAKALQAEVLSDEGLIKNNPWLYSLVLNNYGWNEFLTNNLENLPNIFFKALAINDSLNDQDSRYNSIIVYQHLAEYYDKFEKKDSALYYAYKAKDVSKQYHNDDLLKSLLILSNVEEDDKARTFLNEYIELSDSLQKSERLIRNKFTRIRYETDQIEQENIQIAKERLWLLIISVVVIIASSLLYLVITQRNKNKELQFIQKQQETNEEIYNLMLSQNETIEEARTLEKKRISEELHDGVLGRLFGTRLSLDSLNMNTSVEAIKTRSEYIDGLKQIEDDIRKVSHELNTDFVSGSGFIDIIKTLVETQSIAYGLTVKVKPDDTIDWNELSNKKKIHIYRIVQESLHNIYKHAKASEVIIIFRSVKNAIELQIQDDGIGFDTTKAKTGIGLKNMNSRINEIDGSFNIISETEKGTTVKINVPIS